jgi:hypothetical protein
MSGVRGSISAQPAVGNFPQAFTHIGLINAALTLAEYRDKHAFAGRDRSPIEKRSEDHT